MSRFWKHYEKIYDTQAIAVWMKKADTAQLWEPLKPDLILLYYV